MMWDKTFLALQARIADHNAAVTGRDCDRYLRELFRRFPDTELGGSYLQRLKAYKGSEQRKIDNARRWAVHVLNPHAKRNLSTLKMFGNGPDGLEPKPEPEPEEYVPFFDPEVLL